MGGGSPTRSCRRSVTAISVQFPGAPTPDIPPITIPLRIQTFDRVPVSVIASTLLLLVESFIGPRWRDLYATALTEGYRFLSFGDAMFLERA